MKAECYTLEEYHWALVGTLAELARRAREGDAEAIVLLGKLGYFDHVNKELARRVEQVIVNYAKREYHLRWPGIKISQNWDICQEEGGG